MKKTTLILLFSSLVTILLSAFVIRALFVPVSPYSLVSLPVDAEGAGLKATSMVRELGVTSSLPPARPNLKVNSDLVRTILGRDGQLEGTERLRRSTEGCFWDVEWRFSKGMAQATSDTQTYTLSVGRIEQDSGDFQIRLSPAGSLQFFQWRIPDSMDLPVVTEEWARRHAIQLFHDIFPALAGMDSFEVHQLTFPHRTVSRCTWTSTDTLLNIPAKVTIDFAGDRVLSADVAYQGLAGEPKGFEAMVLSVLTAVLIVGLVIIAAVVAIKRLRVYEMSFSLATKLGIIIGIVYGFIAAIQAGPRELWLTILAAVLSGLFMGGLFIMLWGVGESLGREAWKEKFLSLDLLARGHIFHSLVGRALVVGSALGIAAPSLFLIVTLPVLRIFPQATMAVDNVTVGIFSAGSPVVAAISQSMIGSIFYVAFGLIAMSFLKGRIRNSWTLVLLGSFLLVMGMYGRIEVQPVGGILLLGLPAFLPLAFALVGIDVLSAIVALFLSLFVTIIALFFGAGTVWQTSALVLAGLGCVPLVWGVIALLTADPTVDLEAITPAFVRYITERQRLQRELEIARQVQQSFLPKSVPDIGGLEVASRCTAALEVGGDYYDFLPLGGGRLGVVVGDVSGKGTEAAFFMTLSKGFLRAISKTVESPQEVLIRLNELFCENVDRGEFITMVYAVIDPSTGWVTIARAGHTPPLLWRKQENDIREFLPPGLGLGLESGQRFADIIREERVMMREGDVLLLYTDGFTEAMNKSQEEFGEVRLHAAVQSSPKENAWVFLDSLYREVRQFTGRVAQHDDMTAVVVRRSPIKEPGSGGTPPRPGP